MSSESTPKRILLLFLLLSDSSSDDHEDEDDHPGDPEVNELHPEVNDLSLSPSHSGSSSSLSSTLQGDVITGVHFIQVRMIDNSIEHPWPVYITLAFHAECRGFDSRLGQTIYV